MVITLRAHRSVWAFIQPYGKVHLHTDGRTMTIEYDDQKIHTDIPKGLDVDSILDTITAEELSKLL